MPRGRKAAATKATKAKGTKAPGKTGKKQTQRTPVDENQPMVIDGAEAAAAAPAGAEGKTVEEYLTMQLESKIAELRAHSQAEITRFTAKAGRVRADLLAGEGM